MTSPSRALSKFKHQCLGAVCLLTCLLWLIPGFASDDIWADVQSGKSFIILRHALAPGTGDPENFDIDLCNTQRNLSAEGRQQAQRIGDVFKDNGLENALIYTSQWCRCIDTAKEMGMQQPVELPLLNSFYNNREAGPKQIQNLLQWIKYLTYNERPEQPVIFVTHQVVTTALTGVFPESGEAVIFKLLADDSVEVIHRLPID